MSIPLDRLYNFLHSISGHDLVIYGWRPHGSKKLQDLTAWNQISSDWRVRQTKMPLIFHDQEPLDYNFSQTCVEQELDNIISNWNDYPILALPRIKKFLKTLHLKSVIAKNFYDLTLLVHSEKNSYQVEKYALDNFIPVYYWSHAVIARDWFRFAEHDTDLKVKIYSPKTFLVYNRAWSGTREYRLKFAEQLIAANLHHNCITNFSKFDQQVDYQDHVFSNFVFAIKNKNLETILPKNTHDSVASADYNTWDYQNSLIEVVLETLFDDTRNHLTEKSLRPIACGQPFILASTPGSLQYLRAYGFQTFDGYINETYDTIQDPAERLNAIIQEMQRIDQLCPEAKQQLVAGVQAIVQHNQTLFFSDKFHLQIINEFKQNLHQAVIKVKSGSVGNIWTQIRNIVQEHYPEMFLKYMHQDADDLAWSEQWIQSLVRS